MNDTQITVECPDCGESDRVPVQPESFGPEGGVVYCGCGDDMTAMEPREQ